MLDHDEIIYDDDTGEVRLKHIAGEQLLFRLTRQGLQVWSKAERRERLIPWYTLIGWAVKRIS